MTRENKHITDDQINALKERLLNERSSLSATVKDIEKFSLDKNELKDVLDEASINVQKTQELRFRNREVFYLKKINKALENISKGEYGLCEECNAEIPADRLLARPTAELCITCKEEAEMEENSSLYQKRSHSLGKTLSELSTVK